MISFNKAAYPQGSYKYVKEVMESRRISGDGKFTRLCSQWMESRFNAEKVLLTTSCTSALEMAAVLLGIGNGDEVIMPSYTFVSTASAFSIFGATPVFVDIRKDTMNIDESLIENAITNKTKAIVVVHYAGISCEMNKILQIAHKYNLPVIEDAAQGVMATYEERFLGTIGDIGCYSFHETKNYSMGEGGALVLNNKKYLERAEIIREKGTNRSKFYRGEVDKYTWVDTGSSFLPSEINAAYLYGQLEIADEIFDNRVATWNYYDSVLREELSDKVIDKMYVPKSCVHNGHLYYIKAKDLDERTELIKKLRTDGVEATFHYVPLHSSEEGMRVGRFNGYDTYTTSESNRLVRLPMYYGISAEDKERVVRSVLDFYKKNN